MAEVRNDAGRFGGEYMVQDSDHMSESGQTADNANHGGVRQSEQSQSEGRQQGGGDQNASRQQGDDRAVRQQSGQRRNY